MYYDSRRTSVNASITDSLLVSLLVDKRWRYLRFPNRPAPLWNDDIDDFRWRCVVTGIDTDVFEKSLAHIRDAADKSWPFIVRNSREFEFQMCSRLLHLVEHFRLVAKYVVALARQAHAFGPWLKPMHPCWQQAHPALEIPLQSCIHCLAVSQSASKVAIGAGNKVLILYLNTMLTRQLYMHKCDVTSIAITPDGTRVISGAADGEVRVCDVRTMHAIGDTVFEHYAPVTHIAVAASCKFFVTGSTDCVCVWNTKAATLADVPLRLRNASTSILRGLAISASGRKVLYSTAQITPPGGNVMNGTLFNETVRIEKIKPSRSNSGESVCSGEGSAIGSGSSVSSMGTDDENIPRNSHTSSETKHPPSNNSSFLHRSISLNNVTANAQSHIASHPASEVQRVMTFDIGAGDPPKPVHVNVTERGRGQIPRAFLGCTPDGLAIVRVGIAVVQLIDLETGETIRTIRSVPNWFSCASASSIREAPSNSGVRGNRRQPDDYLFAGWSRNGDDDVAVWRVCSHDGLLSHDGFRLGLGRGMHERDRRRMANAVAFTTTASTPGQEGNNNPNANRSPTARILTGATDGTLRIWDATTSNPPRSISIGNANGGPALFTWVRICPYGRRIATVARDGQMSIWGFDNGRKLYGDEEGPEDMVTAMAFAADGVRVLLGTNSGNLTLWDPAAEVVHEVTWSQGRYISDIRTHSHDANVILVYSDELVSAWELHSHHLRLLDSWDAPDEIVNEYYNPQYQFDTDPSLDPNSDPDPEVDHEFNLMSLHENIHDQGTNSHGHHHCHIPQPSSNFDSVAQSRRRTRSHSQNGRRSVDTVLHMDSDLDDSDDGDLDGSPRRHSRYDGSTHWGLVSRAHYDDEADNHIPKSARSAQWSPNVIEASTKTKSIQVTGRNVIYHDSSNCDRRQDMARQGRMARPTSTQTRQQILATLPAEVNGCNAWHFNEECGTFAAGLRNGTIVRCHLKI